jgi:hypothetical protein
MLPCQPPSQQGKQDYKIPAADPGIAQYMDPALQPDAPPLKKNSAHARKSCRKQQEPTVKPQVCASAGPALTPAMPGQQKQHHSQAADGSSHTL